MHLVEYAVYIRIDTIHNGKTRLLYQILAFVGSNMLFIDITLLFQLITLVTEDGNGLMAVIKACYEPIKQMALNSGLELDKADLKKVSEDKSLTIDFYTGQVVDAFKQGIIDPSLVTLSAVKNAAAEAALFVITEGAVTAAEDDSEKI